MKRILTAAVALGLVLGLTAAAGAADEKKKKDKKGPDTAAVFAKLDTNKDGKLSSEEFGAFKGLKEPKPGKEGKEPKGLAAARTTWFKALDANNDQSVNADEFKQIAKVIADNPARKKKAK